MIIDKEIILGTAQEMNGTDTTVYTTYTIDGGVPNRFGNAQTQKFLEFLVTTAYSGGTSVRFGIYDSADNSTFGKASEGRTITVANAPVGTRIRIPFPEDTKRYFKGGVFTVGAVSAGACTTFVND